jgi:hypothetical protein
MRVIGVLAGLVLLAAQSSASAQGMQGQFKGEVVATMLPDGRNMRLVKPFGYVDSKGQTWTVPAGAETDGASIPKAFWLTHPPFTGKYRSAAVIHDYYCRVQTRTWQATHNVFFEAMRTAGVDDRTAKVMWGAVYNFGPRWGAGVSTRGPGAGSLPNVEKEAQFMRDLDAWIARADPSRDEIAKAIEGGAIPK